MYRLRYSSQFGKDIKLCKRKGLDLSVMQRVISILVRDGKLPKEYSHMFCMATVKGNGNAILKAIGC